MQHLNYEDLERYLNEEDLSEEYLCWLEPVMEHLDSCEICRTKINQMMLIEEVCQDENVGAAFLLLRDEEKVRRKLVAHQLEQTAQDARTKEVAERLKNGALAMILAQKTDFVKSHSVMRDGADMLGGAMVAKHGNVMGDLSIRVRYENKKVYVAVPCEREASVTVVLALQEEQGVKSMMATAMWSEREEATIAEFEVEELGDKYEIYVDLE